ncbi:MAG: DUF4339 domain-containing protein [Planctomycetaceae bacterium]
MVNEWYYQRDGEELGPVPFEKIKELAQSGQLSPDDQIRDAVSGMLLPAKSIGGLFPAEAVKQGYSSTPSARQRNNKEATSRARGPRRPAIQDPFEESAISKISQEALEDQTNRRRLSKQREDRPVSRERGRNNSTSDSGRYESPNARTRRAAGKISEYAERINDHESASEGSGSFIINELKSHPILLTILGICLAGAIFKWFPERDYGPQVYQEFNQIYSEMEQLRAAEATEEEWKKLTEESRAEIGILLDKLAMKEHRTPAEKQLSFIGRQLYQLFDYPGELPEGVRIEFARSLNSVREQVE